LTWIVTGGAGFVGAHVVHLLRGRHDAVVFDDLSSGRVDRLPSDVPVIKGSITNRDDMDRLFAQYPAVGVIHLAARKSGAESVRDAELYRRVNVDGVEQLLGAMRRAGVDRLLFASSAAVYGDPGGRPAGERRQPRPINPYGQSKRDAERLVARAGLRSVVFRKFNVVGAGAHPYAADAASSSLLPAIFQALTGGPDLVVRGSDYPTRDGSAVRDYIHVADVAAAYLRGVDHLSRPRRHRVVNLGSGTGTSVLDLVEIVQHVTGRAVPRRPGPPRGGDAAAVVAAVSRAGRLHLAARRSLTEAVESAWTSWQAHAAR
jgi:UDP-glucose 4-epimerase